MWLIVKLKRTVHNYRDLLSMSDMLLAKIIFIYLLQYFLDCSASISEPCAANTQLGAWLLEPTIPYKVHWTTFDLRIKMLHKRWNEMSSGSLGQKAAPLFYRNIPKRAYRRGLIFYKSRSHSNMAVSIVSWYSLENGVGGDLKSEEQLWHNTCFSPILSASQNKNVNKDDFCSHLF